MPGGPTPPDGGYGWVIVLACLLQMMTGGPIMPMFGVFFKEKFQLYGMSQTDQNAIFMVYLICWNLVTMLVGPLVQLRSERFVGFCSTLCICLGVGLSTLATCKAHMMLTYGLLCGTGMGLSNANVILLLNKYFRKKVGLAFALFAMGLGISAILMPQLIKFLLQNFSSNQAIFIYAAVTTIGFTGAVLYRDVTPFLVAEVGAAEKPLMNQPKVQATKPAENGIKSKESSRNAFVKFFMMIKWRMLLSPYFLMIAFGNSMVFNVMLNYISSMRTITKEKGLTVSQTADIVSIMATSEIVFRFCHGVLSDRPFMHRIFTHPKKSHYTACSIGVCVFLAVLPSCQTFLSTALCIITISVN